MIELSRQLHRLGWEGTSPNEPDLNVVVIIYQSELRVVSKMSRHLNIMGWEGTYSNEPDLNVVVNTYCTKQVPM